MKRWAAAALLATAAGDRAAFTGASLAVAGLAARTFAQEAASDAHSEVGRLHTFDVHDDSHAGNLEPSAAAATVAPDGDRTEESPAVTATPAAAPEVDRTEESPAVTATPAAAPEVDSTEESPAVTATPAAASAGDHEHVHAHEHEHDHAHDSDHQHTVKPAEEAAIAATPTAAPESNHTHDDGHVHATGEHSTTGTFAAEPSTATTAALEGEHEGHSHGGKHGGGHSHGNHSHAVTTAPAHGHGHGHGHGHAHGGDAHRVLRADEKHVVSAMIITTLSGLAAALGGAIVIFAGTPSPAVLGHLLSFACGIMLYISYGDLLPHAQGAMATFNAVTGAPGDDPDGFWGANVALLCGMLFFAAVVWIVPEPAAMGGGHAHAHPAHPAAKQPQQQLEQPPQEEAPLGRPAAAEAPAAPAPPRRRARSVSVAAAGKRRKAAAAAGEAAEGDVGSSGGSGSSSGSGGSPSSTSSAVVRAPAAAPAPLALSAASRDRLAMTGIVAAIGISLHNLPEGLIVYNASITGLCADVAGQAAAAAGGAAPMGGLLGAAYAALGVPPGGLGQCFTRGVAVTLAVALHNIPEGMAVASPLYASTGSRWIAFKWCLLSALCEPAAALLFGVLFSSYLTPHIIAMLNAGVAGIMICLCLIELIPAACEHISPKAAVLSNIAGQATMFLSLHAMRATGMH